MEAVTKLLIALFTIAALALGTAGCKDGVSYKDCAAVKAAGKAPLHKGDPGFKSSLDRDGDGVACDE
jgi:hypothetical protein